jgi:hypothetical protein
LKPDEAKFTSEIELSFGTLGKLVSWCQRNCTGNWAYDVLAMGGQGPGKYRFDFAEEDDYINFVLWQK